MSGSIDKLVHMANQIATAFRHLPEARAVEAVQEHIRNFWDPRMRALIIAHLEAGGAGLNPTARAAVERLAASTKAA